MTLIYHVVRTFEMPLKFKGHLLRVDGNIKNNRVHFYHVYLSGTDIEISDKLSAATHEELCELILKLI